MFCKFCLKDSELCKSHIIPDYFFKRYSGPEPENVLKEVNPLQPFQPRRPKGLYEKLLCPNCESLFAKWDDFAIKFFQKSEQWNRICIEKGAYFEVLNVDYKEIKLFFMSLLWRASVSRLTFYSQVTLGPFESTLRAMLKASNPGKPNEFGVVLCKLKAFNADLDKIILTPTRFRADGVNSYRFDLNEFIFIIAADGRGAKPSKFLLKPSEPVLIIETDVLKSGKLEQMSNVLKLQSQTLSVQRV
jgi:hypothetical protein